MKATAQLRKYSKIHRFFQAGSPNYVVFPENEDTKSGHITTFRHKNHWLDQKPPPSNSGWQSDGLLVGGNGVRRTTEEATLFSDISLVDWWPTRIVLLGVTVLVLGAMFWPARRLVARALLFGLVLILIGVNCLAAVNAYYGFYLTSSQALGYNEDNLGSPQAVASQHTIPPTGTVLTIAIPGKKSGFQARPSHVYLPPTWFGSPRPKLPVIVLLHGTPGSPTDWLHGGEAKITADEWAKSHGGITPIIVMPDINGDELRDTECVDRPNDQAESYLTSDVPDFVQKEFFTAHDKRNWAVAGLSEGGSCAIMLSLRHPNLYPTFADFGGLAGPRSGDTNDPGTTADEFFGGSSREFDQHEPATLLRQSKFNGLHGFFAVGSADPEPLRAARQLSALARAAGIDTQVVIIPGGAHTFDVWSAAFREALPWLADRVGLGGIPPYQAGRLSTTDHCLFATMPGGRHRHRC